VQKAKFTLEKREGTAHDEGVVLALAVHPSPIVSLSGVEAAPAMSCFSTD